MDEITKQKVTELESLLVEYKETIAKMEAEIQDLTGDVSTTGDHRPRAEIVKELEIERRKRETAEEGNYCFLLRHCEIYEYLWSHFKLLQP